MLTHRLSNPYQVLGLWGMGGVGKTTLASTLFNRMLPDFGNAVCFLEDMYKEAKEPGGMLRMQLQLLEAITCEDMSSTVRNKSQGACNAFGLFLLCV